MTRIITARSDEVSPRDFARSIGLRIRTPAEKLAEWQAECERFADMIEASGEWGVPPPCLADARKIVAERALRRKVAGELRFTMTLTGRAA